MNYEKINQNIYDYILNCNQNFKDRTALDYLGKTYTFKEVEENINNVIKSLISLGVKKGDNIAVLSLATPEFIYLMYASAKIGATLSILNPLDNSNYEKILSDTNIKYLFCLDTFYNKVQALIEHEKLMILPFISSLPIVLRMLSGIKSLVNQDIISYRCTEWKKFIKKGELTNLPEFENFEENFNIIQIGTGGSTGIPKNVGLSNEMLNNIIYNHHLMNKSKNFDVSFNDFETFLDVIPPHLAYGVCDVHLALSFRMKLCLEPIPDPKKFVNQLKKHNPHHVLAGPVHWKQMIGKKTFDLSNLKTAVAGGERLENKDEVEINKILEKSNAKVKVKEGIGLTEIGGVGTFNTSDDLFTVGRPLPEYVVGIFKADINDENYNNTKTTDELSKVFYTKNIEGDFDINLQGLPNIEGEICYQLPVKVLGYIGLEHEDENKKLLRVHEDGKVWVHTGDLGYINENKNLIVSGRIKRIFNRYGWKIYPTYLSNIVTNSNLVKECVVVKRKSSDPKESYVPVLYAVLKNEKDADKLKEYVVQNLKDNYKIYDIIIVEELPKTTAGKINFNLVEMYDSQNNEPATIKELEVKKLTLLK